MRKNLSKMARLLAITALIACLALPLSACGGSSSGGGAEPPASSEPSNPGDGNPDDGNSGDVGNVPVDPSKPETWPVEENGTLTVPETVTQLDWDKIQSAEIANQDKINSVTLPASVESIDLSGANVTSIPVFVATSPIENVNLNGCIGLTNETLKDVVQKIGQGNFENIDLSNTGLTSIAGSTFVGNQSLTSVELPVTLVTIEDSAFKNCSNLTSIVLPSSVTKINDEAFAGCTGLTEIVVQSGTGEKAAIFSLFGVESQSTENIYVGKNAFLGCTELLTVILPDKVTYIDAFAFKGCAKLQKLILRGTVTGIGTEALSDCKNLQYITLNAHPTGEFTIGENALNAEANTNVLVCIPEEMTAETMLGIFSKTKFSPKWMLHIHYGDGEQDVLAENIKAYLMNKCGVPKDRLCLYSREDYDPFPELPGGSASYQLF